MRKLSNTDKNIKATLEGIASSCNCKYRCRGDENSLVLQQELYQGSMYGGPEPVRINTDI